MPRSIDESLNELSWYWRGDRTRLTADDAKAICNEVARLRELCGMAAVVCDNFAYMYVIYGLDKSAVEAKRSLAEELGAAAAGKAVGNG